MPESVLWSYLILHQNELFYMVKHLPFIYKIKTERCGNLTKELIIDLRESSKTLTWSSIQLVLKNAEKLNGEVITRPKQLGDIRGVSYIYPIFWKAGIIEIPEEYKW